MTAKNSTPKIFYTYAHYRSDELARGPFYIGKGQGRRAFRHGGRSKHWKHIAAKHGVTVEILAHWNTEDEAHQHEVLLIECFRHLGIGLANLTIGGEGMTKPDPEVRARIAAGALASWADPVTRQRMIEARSTPEVKARKSAALKTALNKPESRAKRSAGLKKAKASERSKARRAELGSDPAYRAKLSASVKAACATPEAKAKKSAASRAMWQDPDHAKQFAELVRAKAEARWAQLPPEEASRRRHMADLHRIRKARQKTSEPSFA